MRGEGTYTREGGLITGCIILFTGKWACNWGSGGGELITGGLLYLQLEILTIPLSDPVNSR